MLYRSTDRRCRCGAPMKNLAHSASLESLDKNAPSKTGTKQLASLFPSLNEHLRGARNILNACAWPVERRADTKAVRTRLLVGTDALGRDAADRIELRFFR